MNLDVADDGTLPLYTWLDFHTDVRALIAQIKESGIVFERIIAIPRGGLVLGLMLSHAFTIPLAVRDYPEATDPPATLVVDDYTVTGSSLGNFDRGRFSYAVLVKHPGANVVTPCFCARETEDQYLFPWEAEASHDEIPIDDLVVGGS
jgi:adenine/guanine phosphoribosyltransferase-like PRPP-binding protein